MFVWRVRSKGKDGKTYLSVRLRESKRVGQKVFSRTLAVLTYLPEWLIGLIERAVEKGKDARSLKELVALSNSRRGLRFELSFGAVYLFHQNAKSCGIPDALGPSQDAKLALGQVLGRTLSPSTTQPANKSCMTGIKTWPTWRVISALSSMGTWRFGPGWYNASRSFQAPKISSKELILLVEMTIPPAGNC